MAEDADLISALDSLEGHKGPQPLTCEWWANASDELREATRRNVAAKTHTAVARLLRDKGQRVTSNGIRDHVNGSCKCQKTS